MNTEQWRTTTKWLEYGRQVKPGEVCRKFVYQEPVYATSQTDPREEQRPELGTGEYSHCYVGQEANLMAHLKAKHMTLAEFNRIWDRRKSR
jgi:hypothetical protein